MEIEKLKPCPFCGGEAKIEWIPPVCKYVVECLQCGMGSDPSTSCRDKNELIKLWNTRADEKQAGKKVICETVDEKGIEYEFEHYKCPNCKRIVHQRYKKSKEPMRYRQNYCVDCGQLLNWSDEQ